MASLPIDQPSARSAARGSRSAARRWQGLGVAAVLALAGLASGLHVLVGRYVLAVDSRWFVIVGVGFLAVTAAAHLSVSRSQSIASQSPATVGVLLISMAIRFAGTFVILGLLLWLSPLQRPEAVFNVLFWYITLTAIDVFVLVRERRRVETAAVDGRRLAIGRGESQ